MLGVGRGSSGSDGPGAVTGKGRIASTPVVGGATLGEYATGCGVEV